MYKFGFRFIFLFFLGPALLWGIIEEESRLVPKEFQEYTEGETTIDYDAEIQRLEQIIDDLEKKQANVEIEGGEAGMMYDYSEGADDAQEAKTLKENIREYKMKLKDLKEEKKKFQKEIRHIKDKTS